MQDTYLDFTIAFFHRLNMATRRIHVTEPMPDDMDLGLRRSITPMTKKPVYFTDFISDDFMREHIIYLSTDKYDCHYIYMPLTEDGQDDLFIVGPYLTELASIVKTNEICKRLGIPEALHRFVHQYFSTLPSIRAVSVIESYVDTLAEALYGSGNYQIEYIRQPSDRRTPFRQEIEADDNKGMMERVEYRYSLERRVIDAIAAGDFKRAMKVSSDPALSSIDNRSTNTLRSKKNNLLAFNTVCRKGAEMGGVHPLFLDEMSRRMAILIENMTAVEQDIQVHREVLKNYCEMVQKKASSGYSPTVERAVVYITQNLLDTNLTLQSAAEALSLNKSYLATQFKKETGDTFTGFVNKRRLDHAIFLLNTSSEPVQTIASACGIPDAAYFTRVFKQEKGMTPGQYRKMVRQ